LGNELEGMQRKRSWHFLGTTPKTFLEKLRETTKNITAENWSGNLQNAKQGTVHTPFVEGVSE